MNVTSLVPDGGDPHSYEPSLGDVRNVVYADVAFSNHVMLEEHNPVGRGRLAGHDLALGEATFTMAVGVPPEESGVDDAVVLSQGRVVPAQ